MLEWLEANKGETKYPAGSHYTGQFDCLTLFRISNTIFHVFIGVKAAGS